jgi:hypothetical protein
MNTVKKTSKTMHMKINHIKVLYSSINLLHSKMCCKVRSHEKLANNSSFVFASLHSIAGASHLLKVQARSLSLAYLHVKVCRRACIRIHKGCF